jgi:DNA-binding LacI/PurR family transcriptional regulator
MPRVTLQTVADRVGVSRMTVSNAFSRPDQLSAALRERILAAARELGYVGPDPKARALARGTTGAVGIVLTESLRSAFTDLVATSFLGAIAEELAPTGLALTLISSVGNARDVAIDGALVYACDPASPAVDWLVRRKLPLVYVDQNPVDGIPSVNVADRHGARAAAQHVVDLGHRRVGLLMSGLHGQHGLVDDPYALVDGYPSRQRMLGWFDALEPAGIHPVIVRTRTADEGEVRSAARLLLDRDDPPTAVLCFSDTIAYGVTQVAADLGLRVPEDLSVVGFDDHPLASQIRPSLTTVRQNVEEKGRAAAALLTGRLAGHVMLPTELIVRQSTQNPLPPREVPA